YLLLFTPFSSNDIKNINNQEGFMGIEYKGCVYETNERGLTTGAITSPEGHPLAASPSLAGLTEEQFRNRMLNPDTSWALNAAYAFAQRLIDGDDDLPTPTPAPAPAPK